MNGRSLTIVVAFVLVALGPGKAGAAEYSASYSLSAIGDVSADTVIKVSVHVLNTGTRDWTGSAPNRVQLGYHWSRVGESAWLGESEAPTLLTYPPESVAAGKDVTITAGVHTPRKPGTYVLRFDCYAMPGPGWFSSVGVPTGDQKVTVVAGPPTAKEPLGTLGNLLFSVPPKIEEIFPLSNIRPGGVVAVRGSGFGDKFGEFYLKLASGIIYRIWNSPGLWKDHVVSGLMDPESSGLMDEDATLYVKTADGKLSNGWPVKFRARRDVKLLPPADVVTKCSEVASENNCGDGDSVSTVNGYHREDYPMGHTGSDIFSFTLKNGWVVDSYKFSPWAMNGWVKDPSGLFVGADNVKLHITWHVDAQWYLPGEDPSVVSYFLDIYITGPAGVPYK